MRTTQQLKEEIYQEVENSGFYKNVQAQVKAHVLEVTQTLSRSSIKKLTQTRTNWAFNTNTHSLANSKSIPSVRLHLFSLSLYGPDSRVPGKLQI